MDATTTVKYSAHITAYVRRKNATREPPRAVVTYSHYADVGGLVSMATEGTDSLLDARLSGA
jgi:hypothetical protein